MLDVIIIAALGTVMGALAGVSVAVWKLRITPTNTKGDGDD